LYQIFGTIGVT